METGVLGDEVVGHKKGYEAGAVILDWFWRFANVLCVFAALVYKVGADVGVFVWVPIV